jgi:hypothetical protein
MLFYTQRLTDALNKRFDDMDEVYDVANYGCKYGCLWFRILPRNY